MRTMLEDVDEIWILLLRVSVFYKLHGGSGWVFTHTDGVVV